MRQTENPASARTDRRRLAGTAGRKHGRRAEWLAALMLVFRGYRLLARNWRSPAGEIDIIARRGDCLVVVEVKTRIGALQARQCRRLVRAAGHFQARHPELAGLSLRFDLMVVGPFWRVRHLPDAFRPEF